MLLWMVPHGLQVAVVTETAVVGATVMGTPPHVLAEFVNGGVTAEAANTWLPSWSTSEGDFVCACVCMCVFVLGHLWFFGRLFSSNSHRHTEVRRFSEAEHNQTVAENGDGSYIDYRRRASLPGGAQGGLPNLGCRSAQRRDNSPGTCRATCTFEASANTPPCSESKPQLV
jgi:hypothetical protein